jgi:hypothetical protein
MPERTVEDRLREQYFSLFPDIRRVAWQLETEIRFHTLSTLHKLKRYEKLVIKPRIKECESAIQALRRRQEGGTFDQEKPESYSLLRLPDLAGVRVLVFPRSRLNEVDDALRTLFADWTSDPVLDDKGAVLAPKYNGHCRDASLTIQAEYQIVPMLIGLYWQVEHSAIYKPAPTVKALKDKADSEPMEKLNTGVVRALLDFEAEYERIVKD